MTEQESKSTPDTISCYSIFNSELGQRCLENMKHECGFNADVITPNAEGQFDTHAAAQKDGQHKLIRRIEAKINQLNSHGQTTKKSRVSVIKA